MVRSDMFGAGGRKAGTPNKATSMKTIVQRLATEDGELLYSAIQAGLATHGQPISMAAVRLCLEYGIGLPAKQAMDTGRGDIIVVPKYPIGTDPKVMDRLLRVAADHKASKQLRPG